MKRRKKIEAHLQRLANEGDLTARRVLEDARDPDSPLHREFDWDDSVAAEKWRIEQARRLIRSVKVEVTYETHTVAAPYYVRDPRKGDAPGYASVVEIKSDTELARETLAAELDRALRHLARVESLAEELDLTDEYQRAVDAVRRLRVGKIEYRSAIGGTPA